MASGLPPNHTGAAKYNIILQQGLSYLHALRLKTPELKVNNMYDVIIIGGGPAGLNAAMILGRSRRKVILLDSGKPRNRWARNMNGFLSSDGMAPKEFIKKGRAELAKYNVELVNVEVVSATHTKGNFVVDDKNGKVYRSRKLLLATGLKDTLPELEGVEEMYGKSIHHCPYCDGWESRDKAIAVYGPERHGIGQALAMTNWSGDVTLYTDGTNDLRHEDLELLKRNEVKVEREKIVRLEGADGMLQHIVLYNGEKRPQQAMFFSLGTDQQSDLGQQLGCEFTSDGVIKTRRLQHSNIPGLFVAGDAARDMQMVIVAAAEGAKAGVAINIELQEEDRK
ncbi:NAD(P)/FAD-dependent oxidoreductase [Pontibacter anaerobius]|uniref:NAD(P)/FAD-dependent oxidoreductase n=1 Tax=Pontibacter anaerobius TaxID=2993940 RepID=A0ABT3RGU2_9BACT|nr:NAD(P)/FAD-dependent oxidoreductase [Pontibacter anaerobius]MCX2740703.1 NAD(P)/FAD-dependent oxidoreductase [Pontibacter anaerobius]